MLAKLRFKLEVHGGQKYFLEIYQRGVGPRTIRETFRAMEEHPALELMKDYRFTEPKNVNPRIPRSAPRIDAHFGSGSALCSVASGAV